MADYFKYADGTTNTLDQVASNLSGQANDANTEVNK
ncbi:MAG: EscF/YscF/HrpA family type III secretion system needle major subunit, partial [Aeromonas veronii]